MTHETARWYWAYSAKGAVCAQKNARTGKIANAPRNQSEVMSIVNKSIFRDGPVHATIPAGTRSIGNQVTFHISKLDYPANAFVCLSDHILIASPELCFLQAAEKLSFIKTVEYGCNLCGVFYLDNTSESGTSERDPITTKAKIASFLEKCTGHRGYRRAKTALSYVLENSASPAESKGATMLSLPLRYGGYGLYGLALNVKIDIPKRFRGLIDKAYLKADFMWPGTRVTAEYDSDAAHTKSHQISRDHIRVNALQSMGYYSCGITKLQMESMLECDRIAETLRRELKYKQRKKPKNYAQRKRELRSELGLPIFLDVQ